MVSLRVRLLLLVVAIDVVGTACDDHNLRRRSADIDPAIERLLLTAGDQVDAGADPLVIQHMLLDAAARDERITATALDVEGGVVGIQLDGGAVHLLAIEPPDSSPSNRPRSARTAQTPGAAASRAGGWQPLHNAPGPRSALQTLPPIVAGKSETFLPGSGAVAILSEIPGDAAHLVEMFENIGYQDRVYVEPGAGVQDYLNLFRSFKAGPEDQATTVRPSVYYIFPMHSGQIELSPTGTAAIPRRTTWLLTTDQRSDLPMAYVEALDDGSLFHYWPISPSTADDEDSRVCLTPAFLRKFVPPADDKLDHPMFYFNGQANHRDGKSGFREWFYSISSGAEVISWIGSVDVSTRQKAAMQFFKFCTGYPDAVYDADGTLLASAVVPPYTNVSNVDAWTMLLNRSLTFAASGGFMDYSSQDGSFSITLAPSVRDVVVMENGDLILSGWIPADAKADTLERVALQADVACTGAGPDCYKLARIDTVVLGVSPVGLTLYADVQRWRVSAVERHLLEWDLVITKHAVRQVAGYEIASRENFKLYVRAFPGVNDDHYLGITGREPTRKLSLGSVAAVEWEYEATGDCAGMGTREFSLDGCGSEQSTCGGKIFSTGTDARQAGLTLTQPQITGELVCNDGSSIQVTPVITGPAGYLPLQFASDSWTIESDIHSHGVDLYDITVSVPKNPQIDSQTAR